MILNFAALGILVYTGASLLARSHWPMWLRWLAFALILLACGKYLIYQWLGGAFFAPDLPRPFLLCMETLYGILILLTLLLLYFDVASLVLWLARKAGLSLHWPWPAHCIKTALALVAVVAGMYGSWAALRVPDVRSMELRLPHLPQALDGMRIIQLTDLHLGQLLGRDWLHAVVEKANARKPDIIALTGDYIDGHVDQIGHELAPLADLKARHGVFGVTGNHEYYWGITPWVRRLTELGVTMLHNEHRAVPINGATLAVGGMPDPNEARFGGPGPDFAATFANLPDDSGTFRLLLEHQPKHARDYAAQTAPPHLILSGHTHGGMTLPLMPVIACFNKGFVNGLYRLPSPGDQASLLYVSPGTALWGGFSSRVGVPAEITELILRRGSE